LPKVAGIGNVTVTRTTQKRSLFSDERLRI
jgi:hypothetical protein